MKHLTLVAIAMLTLGVPALGCGSDDSTTATISKAEFIKKADAACKQTDKELEQDFLAFVAKNNIDFQKDVPEGQAREMVDSILTPAVEREIKVIRALGAPSGDEAQIDALINGLETGLQKAEAEPQIILHETDKAFKDSSVAAQRYGLKTCGI